MWGSPSGSDEDGDPWQECFDGHDNDCDGDTDCGDSGCEFVLNDDHTKVCFAGEEKVCDSSSCGEMISNGITTYYCVYDPSSGWKWSGSRPSGFCCSDDDCSGYDPDTHTKMVCDCPSGSCSYPAPPQGSDDYTCKALPSCSDNSQCDPNYCCVDDPNGPKPGTGKCVGKGIYSDNPKYLCDPPDWTSGEAEKQVKSSENIFELIIDFFSKILSRDRYDQ